MKVFRISAIFALVLVVAAASLLIVLVDFGVAAPSSVCTVPGVYATIQDAVNAAGCDVIDVSGGTFHEHVVINRAVTIQGQGVYSTIVDGSGSGRVFEVQSNGVVMLSGLKIINGSAWAGGGALNQGTLSIDSCDFTTNYVSHYGGAIHNYDVLTVTNTTFNSNTAWGESESSGGAIFNNDDGVAVIANATFNYNESGNGGAIYTRGDLTINDSLIWESNARGGYGGSIYNDGTGIVRLSNSTLKDNTGERAAAIYNNLHGTIVVTGSTITKNSSEDYGNIYNRGDITVISSTISMNHSEEGEGGGIYNDTGSLTILDSTVSDNAIESTFIFPASLFGGVMGRGGGVYNDQGLVTIDNSTFSNNFAGIYGGGLHNRVGIVDISNSTFTGNWTGSLLLYSGSGGGINNNGGTVKIANTILSGNYAPIGNDCRGAITSMDYNLIRDTSDCTIIGTTTHNIYGQDALLGPLTSEEGGPTAIHQLLSGSPAIDAGYCPGATNDQRGFSRLVDINGVTNVADACDMGAYEMQPGLCWVPGSHATIQQAIDDVACHHVYLSNHTYYEQLSVNRTVMLEGVNPDETIIDGSGTGRVFDVQSSGILTLTQLAVNNGNAASGAGIDNDGEVYLDNTTFTGNVVTHYGGAIFNKNLLIVNESTFVDNNASGAVDASGGAINTSSSGKTIINNSTLTQNSAVYGGGVGSLGVVSVQNSTLYSNTATYGGAIESGGVVTITSSTMIENTATEGGGIRNSPFASGVMTVDNSIVAQNATGGDCQGVITSQGYNIASDNSCSFTGTGDQQSTDPLLGPLQDNGGPTLTQALLMGSPAIDAGSCPALAYDQRDANRPVDLPEYTNVNDGCDIGAFEVQPPVCYVPGDYATIQSAVDYPRCDVIEVGFGTFRENITVDRPVTIQGIGASNTIVDGQGLSNVFYIVHTAVVTLTDMTITHGKAYHGAAILNHGTVTISQCAITGNFADLNGGAILTTNMFSIYDSVLENNVAIENGGAIYNNGATVTISQTTFTNNSGALGGGLYNNMAGTVDIDSSTMSLNSAETLGGAVSNQGSLDIINSTFFANAAPSGGGIFNTEYMGEPGTLTMTHCTISNNLAENIGGGIWNTSVAYLNNTILADNTADNGGPDCYDTIISQDYNLLEDTADCTLTGNTSHNITGQDPRLGDLQDNGGSTYTQALLVGSPALDSGNCISTTVDQRGISRPVDLDNSPNVADGCDIGAYEREYWTVHLPVVTKAH